LTEGVDARALARMNPTPVKRLKDGRLCRDRLPWGGIGSPDSCDCKGKCRFDEGG